MALHPHLGDWGTLVREEWDITPVPWLYPTLRVLGFPERNRRAMEHTLARLEARVEAAPN